MKASPQVLVLALAWVAGVDRLSAAVVINETFDTYANQAALDAVWTPIGTTAPQGVLLTTSQAKSSPNSVHVPGTTLNNQYRSQRTFAETGGVSTSMKLIFSFDFYDSAPTGPPARNYINLQDTTSPSSTNQLVALGFNNNQTGANSGGQYYMARILGFSPPAADPDGGPNESVSGSGAFFKLNDFGVGQRSLGWHNLKVEISTNDGLSTDYSFFVDNQLAERVSDVGNAAMIRSFDNIRIGSGLSNNSTSAYFDNISLVSAVPEASSFLAVSLASLASLGVVWFRGKRAKAA